MKRTLILAAAMTPGTAFAHGLAAHGTLGSGFAHPLAGVDHIIAMLAVGVLAAGLGGRAVWMLPLSFVVSLVLGGVLGLFIPGFHGVEPMILASMVVLGGMVAFALRPAMSVLIGMVPVFGLAHGWAHGAEAPAQGFAVYAVGFVVATAGLHLVGMVMARVLTSTVLRVLGAGSAVAGLALALA